MAISESNTRILVTLPKDIMKKIEDDARKEDRSISNMILRIIKEYYTTS